MWDMDEASNSALSTTSERNDGHTDIKKHKYDVCSKLFRFKSALVQHNKIHTNETNLKCDVCSNLFHRKSNLVQHKKIHSNEKNSYLCFECGKNLTCRDGIIKHLRRHKKCPFKCDKCKKDFITAVQLDNHYKVHIKDEKNYKCDVCSKLFREKSTLVEHKTIHTNEKNHKCDVCSKRFRLKSNLVRHKKVHTNEKNHKCDVCLKLFRLKSNLMQHKKIHSNEKNSYLCFECGKNLTCREGIIKHLRRHKKYPFKCDKCKKGFITAVQLDNHYKVHIKEKLFSCNLCAGSFVEKRKLKSHVKHIHNNVEYDVKAINPSEPMDNFAPIEVKVEPTELSESKPFNVSIIYNEEDVKDAISLTNSCVISSAIDEIKQENCIVKLENYDVESVGEEKLGVVV